MFYAKMAPKVPWVAGKQRSRGSGAIVMAAEAAPPVESGMAIDPDALKRLVERELESLTDARVIAHIRSLLVEPKVVLRDWDYGEPGQQYPCWSVLEDDASRTGIAYCESGFGPGQPWGLVWLGGVEQTSMSMGMDSGWYSTFLDAVFESRAVAPLPIWRVFRSDASGDRRPITGEDTWETT
jgi:hypothetical protein